MTNQNKDNNMLLTTTEAAGRLKLTAGTLKIWRMQGKGPKFVRLGKRCVRYQPDAIDAFIASNESDKDGGHE